MEFGFETVIDIVRQQIDWKRYLTDHNLSLGESKSTDSRGDPIVYIRCPNQAIHTTGGAVADTCIIIPSDGGAIFKCFHNHCVDYTIADYKKHLGEDTFVGYQSSVELKVREHFKEPDDMEDTEPEKLDLNELTITKTVVKSDLVIPVGYFKSNLFFYSADSKQYLEYNANEINIPMLCSNWEYWIEKYPDAFEVNKKTGELVRTKNTMSILKESLILACKKTDRRLDHVEILETGIYRDRGRIIANLGKRCFVDNVETEYCSIKSDFLYQASGDVVVSEEESTVEDFCRLVDILSRSTLSNKTDAWLLPCIIACGYLSGMSDWRTHCWVVGSKGSGKTELKELVISVLASAIGGIIKEGNLTEAAIRQLIQKKATIFIHDEAELSKNIDTEIATIRVNSAGGNQAKGTVSGRALEFKCSSTFILLSISSSLVNEVDTERFIKIYLQQRDDTVSSWPQLKKNIENFLTAKQAAKFCKRIINNALTFNETVSYIRSVFISYFVVNYSSSDNLPRYADNYCGILATYFILSGNVLSEESIIAVIKTLQSDDRFNELCVDKIGDSSDSNPATDLFDRLLDEVVSYSNSDGKRIENTIRGILNDPLEPRKECLYRYGIYWLPEERRIKLKYKNRYLTELFEKHGVRSPIDTLKNIPGAIIPKEKRRINNERFRGLEIPFDAPPIQPERIDLDKLFETVDTDSTNSGLL